MSHYTETYKEYQPVDNGFEIQLRGGHDFISLLLF